MHQPRPHLALSVPLAMISWIPFRGELQALPFTQLTMCWGETQQDLCGLIKVQTMLLDEYAVYSYALNN